MGDASCPDGGDALVTDTNFIMLERRVQERYELYGGGPNRPVLRNANSIAEETGATLTLLQTVPVDASDERRGGIQAYHDNPRRILTVVADSRVLATDDRPKGLSWFAESADLLVTTTQRRGIQGIVFGRPGDRLVDGVDCTAVMVQPLDARKSGLIQRVLIDRLFNK